MNKKQLYESIMKDVSKIIKKHLNEDMGFSDLFDQIDEFISGADPETFASDLDGSDLSEDLYTICQHIANVLKLDVHSVIQMFMLNRDLLPFINEVLSNIVTDYDYDDRLIAKTFR